MTDKDLQKAFPIQPNDEYIIMFNETLTPADVKTTLTGLFNKHSKGEVILTMPGGTTVLVKNIDWNIVNELKANKDLSSIGPNRKAFL